MYENSLFIFRRDLRYIDNIGLINACKNSINVYTIFIFTPEQVKKNNYKSDRSVLFMIESLQNLKKNIPNLHLFYGTNEDVLKNIFKNININCIFYNKDYTPYSKYRDNIIINISKKYNINVIETQDYYLYEPGSILNNTNQIYKKFTPYYNKAIHINVDTPSKYKCINIKNMNMKKIKDDYSISLKYAENLFINKSIKNNIFNGGRDEALKKLNKIKNLSHYDKNRNFLSYNTTNLSPYVKFGNISIREFYHKIKKLFGLKHDLIRQLIWREFYINILNSYPYVLEKSFKQKYNKMKWNNNIKLIDAWKQGNTGFPIVDASMRNLNNTGYISNRSRLIVSNFLVKILFVDWKIGEKYFATKLIDYDPASNNGNWQWVAGTGTDSQPYFRILNPWTQSKKYDEDTSYIKKWIPELKNVPPQDIHNWYKTYINYNYSYTNPIVDYEKQRDYVLNKYIKL